VRTPFRTRDECPRQGRSDGPICRLEIDEAWRPALKGLAEYPRIEVLYWMHQARRDLLVQAPKTHAETYGTFALRSPVRPNPIATSIVDVIAVEPDAVLVRGLDCVDGTPLLDIKPYRCLFTPKAPANPGGITAEASP
jgi:tRNA-Thr(GGU) m(6)t(6)A37 methyltransferase TsaA